MSCLDSRAQRSLWNPLKQVSLDEGSTPTGCRQVVPAPRSGHGAQGRVSRPLSRTPIPSRTARTAQLPGQAGAARPTSTASSQPKSPTQQGPAEKWMSDRRSMLLSVPVERLTQPPARNLAARPRDGRIRERGRTPPHASTTERGHRSGTPTQDGGTKRPRRSSPCPSAQHRHGPAAIASFVYPRSRRSRSSFHHSSVSTPGPDRIECSRTL